MNSIILIKKNGAWVARFEGPHKFKIVELFGCNEIPTAFTDVADGETVREAIKSRNPDCTVLWFRD